MVLLMNQALFKTIFLTSILFHNINADEEIRCTGGDAAGMEEGCVVIENDPLVFTGEFEDEEFVREKMATIRRIESGVEVFEFAYLVFDFLKNVEDIGNRHGPALTFRENKNLKSIQMESLMSLTGEGEAILFDNDNFPIEVYENRDALQELLHLEAAARVSHQGPECSEVFIRITETKPTSYGWFMYTLIALCVLMTALVTFQAFRVLKAKGVFGKKAGNSGDLKIAKGSKNESKNKNSKSSGKSKRT